MTAVVILIATLVGAAYAASTGTTLLFGGPLTVYVGAFIAGLATASLYALHSGDRRCTDAALVLIANFGFSHWAWTTDAPLHVSALIDLATAAYFVAWGRSRWELAIGVIFAVSAVLGALAGFGIVPDHAERQGGFIAFSFPDLAAILGHFANAVLGIGAGDTGKRIKAWASTRIWRIA